MPIGRYIAWVGTALLVLLFVTNWFLPQFLAEPTGDRINRPIIRIVSVQRLPERIVIDTSLPTIVPPPTPVENAAPGEPSPLQSYASAAPPTTVAEVNYKKRKVVKRQGPKVAGNQSPLAITPTAASGNSATTVPPTKLSFMDIISGRLARNLLNLN